MTKIIRATPAIAVLLASTVLAGCGGGGGGSTPAGAAAPTGFPSCLSPGRPVALAIGARSNSATPVLSAAVTAAMNSAISANQPVVVVRLDGDPRIVFNQAFNPQGANSQTRQADRNAYITHLNQILQGTSQSATDIRAQVPQANVLQAIEVAASEVPQGGNVIVMDSGLQTTAPLNFATGLLGDAPQSIVDFLKSGRELPNLAGRNVYFTGLGWTAAPQPALDARNRSAVVQIWNDIAAAAGAHCVSIDQSADTQAAVPDRPPVAVVTPPPPPHPPTSCSVTDLSDANNVGFQFDSTTYRDPSGARATLSMLAHVILSTGESVALTGATSSEGSDQYNLSLSLRRAQAVKATLVQLGVPGARITTRGVGSHLQGRLNDRSPNGQLLIGPAIQNRKVVAKLTGPSCGAS